MLFQGRYDIEHNSTQHNDTQHCGCGIVTLDAYAECCYAECHFRTNKYIMLSAIMLSVIMLSVIMLSVAAPGEMSDQTKGERQNLIFQQKIISTDSSNFFHPKMWHSGFFVENKS